MNKPRTPPADVFKQNAMVAVGLNERSACRGWAPGHRLYRVLRGSVAPVINIGGQPTVSLQVHQVNHLGVGGTNGQEQGQTAVARKLVA